MAVDTLAPATAQLTLGTLELWRPPFISFELTNSRNNLTKNACGQTLDSTDLTYKVYISANCTLAESQEIQRQIEEVLKQAPNLTLTRRDSNDALVFRNKVRSGSVDLSTDQTDLRARFTDRHTLVLILQLEILPAGVSGSGDAQFLNVKRLGAEGLFNWASMDVGALLFTEDSTIPSELFVERLDGFVNKAEATNTGYARETITGKSVSVGSIVQLIADNPSFLMDAGTEDITGMLLFEDNGSDASSIPLFVISFAPFNPDGTERDIPLDLTGLW